MPFAYWRRLVRGRNLIALLLPTALYLGYQTWQGFWTFASPDYNDYLLSCVKFVDDQVLGYDRSGRRFFHWRPDDMPLKVHVPLPPGKNERRAQRQRQAVVAGITAWAFHAPDVVQIEIVEALADASIAVTWVGHFSEDINGRASLSVTTNKRKEHVLQSNGIHLALHAKSRSAQRKARAYTLDALKLVAMHEMGHSLGLGHSDHVSDIMTLAGAELSQGISPRDIRTLRRLYAISNGTSPSQDELIAFQRDLLAVQPEHLSELSKLGDMLMEAKDYGGARQIYERALEIDPTDVQSHIDLAGLWTTIGDADTALAHYRKAIQRGANSGYAFHQYLKLLKQKGSGPELCAVKADMLASDRIERDEVEHCISAIDKSWYYWLMGMSPHEKYYSGYTHYKLGHFADARAALEVTAEALPEHAEANHYLSLAYLFDNAEDKALSTHLWATQLNDQLAKTFYNEWGMKYYTAGEFKQANDLLKIAADIQADPDARYYLASSYEFSKDYAQALEAYELVASNSPKVERIKEAVEKIQQLKARMANETGSLMSDTPGKDQGD